MSTAKISASMMCADQLNLARDIAELEDAGVDYLHLDLMDGAFVPNLTLGINTANAIKKRAKLPIDIHLLCERPVTIIRSLDFGEGDFVTVHAECSDRIMEGVAFVKQRGASFGLALNPDTTVDEIEKYLPYVDMLNVMLIVPGFAGSTPIHGIMDKVRRTHEFLVKGGYNDIVIEVDGSVTPERAGLLSSYGASVFVAGTSSVFKTGHSIADGVRTLRGSI